MLTKRLLGELQAFVESQLNIQSFDVCESQKYICEEILHNELEDFVKNKRQKTFAEILFSFIDKKTCTDTDIYKKAGIDRRHFSKIRSNSNYRIGKNTAVALALALQLNKKETEELISSAGFSLSDNDTFDLVIQFCLEKSIYDLDDVNQALDYFSLKPLIR